MKPLFRYRALALVECERGDVTIVEIPINRIMVNERMDRPKRGAPAGVCRKLHGDHRLPCMSTLRVMRVFGKGTA